ncbi:hypothetical protein CQA49_04805 [Helicobacter sp. MIT 00-7814]|uniref:hypothetical protein n=1 Tax=unclassified Helicobacter TaxID=2593540 RepID=UPI000E1E5F84|nr:MULTISPECIES: hypothetical protein [unclassified Helicobacter]RDU54625.1 hypothetical protein CQA49_04805 [Helicobacter sp. MIT 00-7814]RDU54684.1 hypothetical protein CQA37_05290 [Helicobacter sp. MIT 99-10781]
MQLFDTPSKFRRWFETNRYFLVAFFIVLGLFGYGVVLLFGDISLRSLLKLKYQQNALIEEVDSLQKQNAKIQKEIFELRGLEP